MTNYWLSNKTLLATAISTVMLAGCGGDSSTTPEAPSAKNFTVTAIDGYLKGAKILADTNGDGICETDTNTLTTTGGIATLDSQYRDVALCVRAEVGTTIDETRGVIEKAFSLKAMAGSPVITPITDLVASTVSQLPDDATDEDKDVAIQEVADALGVTIDELDSDFIDATNGNRKLAIISEVLVDTVHSSDSETTAEEARKLAESIRDILPDNEDDLKDFHPVIDEGKPTQNHRPSIINQLKDTDIEVGGVVTEFSIVDLFDDKDGDTLNYTVKSLDGAPRLSVSDAGLVSGFDTSKAGEFEYQFFAMDSHGVKSRPASWELTVTTPNTPPTVNDEAVAELNADFDALELLKGSDLDKSFDIADLFDDIDGDELTVTVSGKIDGVSIAVKDGYLTLAGTPSKAGEFTFTLAATDGINSDKAQAEFSINVGESTVEVPHPLENQTFYMLDTNMGPEGSYTYHHLECHAMRLEGGNMYFSADPESHTPASCPELEAEPVGTYSIDGDTITVAMGDDKVANMLIVHQDSDKGYYMLEMDDIIDGKGVDQLYVNKADIEKRLAYRGQDGDLTVDYFFPVMDESAAAPFVLGEISANIGKNTNTGDTGNYDANVFFTTPPDYTFNGKPFSCDFANDVFEEFRLSSVTQEWTVTERSEFECYDLEEDGYPTIAIDFDFDNALIDGDHYTITAKVKEQYQHEFEKVAFSFIYRDFVCTEGDTPRDSDDNPTEAADMATYQAAVTNCQVQTESTQEIIEVLSIAMGGEYFDLFDQDMFYRIYADGQIGIHEKNDDGAMEELAKGNIQYSAEGYLQTPLFSFIEGGEEHTYQVTMAITNLDEPLSSNSISQVAAKFFKHSSTFNSNESKGWVESWLLTLKD